MCLTFTRQHLHVLHLHRRWTPSPTPRFLHLQFHYLGDANEATHKPQQLLTNSHAMRHSTHAHPRKANLFCCHVFINLTCKHMQLRVVVCLERKGEMEKRREALVMCSDRYKGTGIEIWDVKTGNRIRQIPTCASPVNGLVCLRNQCLVASQVSKYGSVGGGAIFTWSLNKPQTPRRSYPIEAISPISCTKDGVYLAGGASSGKAYIWEVANGRLLKAWPAHYKPLKCMAFSSDDSILVSGSDDGMICVWSIISLLDVENPESSSSLLFSLLEHKSSITSLWTISGSANPTFISSSLDATCRAWETVTGRLIQTQEYPLGITATVLHPAEQLLFAGSTDGTIFVGSLAIGVQDEDKDDDDDDDDLYVSSKNELLELKGHRGSITALAFCALGLISASEDCTVCIWDIIRQVVIRKFSQKKGPVTNLVVIPQSSLVSVSTHQKASGQYRAPLLNKFPQPANSPEGTMRLLPKCSPMGSAISEGFQGDSLSGQRIVQMEQEKSTEAMEMEIETCLSNRMWAASMASHVMEMNTHLQYRLVELWEARLSSPADNDSVSKKSKKLKIGSSQQVEGGSRKKANFMTSK